MSLVFSKSQDRKAFRHNSGSQHNDKNGHKLFRELIQNSLDAAQRRLPAEVVITQRRIPKEQIPGLEEIDSAVDAANEFWANYPETQIVVPKIKQALSQKDFDILIFRDNGVGLNKDRMNDILFDGASRKKPGSAGSYGNGHFSTFNFSRIFYVLYIGVSEEGTLFSGQTRLASHKVPNGFNSENGYLVKEILDDVDNGFNFFDGDEIQSDIMRQTCSEIKQEANYGSAVIITAFDIDNDENLVTKIKRYSSLHFFPAIFDDELIVHYLSENGTEVSINSDNMKDVLSKFSDERQSKGLPRGPSGEKTYQAFITYSRGKKVSVETTLGNVDCFLRTSEVSGQNINLFRKGMWISQKITGLESRYFSEFSPFDLVINVKYQNNPRLHDLIRSSEGSLHMHLERRNGHENDWDKLKQFWSDFREALKIHLTKVNYNEFSPDDFALIDVGDDTHPDNQANSSVQKWTRGKSNKDQPSPSPSPPSPEDEGYFKILGSSAELRGQARRSNDNFLVAEVVPEKNIKYPELRIAEVLGADATCDISGDVRLSDLQYCEIEEITLNGKSFDFLSTGRGITKKPSPDGQPTGVFAVRLQAFSESKSINFLIKFKPSLGDPRSSIRLDIVDRTREMEADNAS